MSEQIPNSETRPVSGFNKLVLKGVGSVILTQGAQESLVIEADPDIRSRIRSEVRDGTLTISYDFDLISDVFGLRFIGAPPHPLPRQHDQHQWDQQLRGRYHPGGSHPI